MPYTGGEIVWVVKQMKTIFPVAATLFSLTATMGYASTAHIIAFGDSLVDGGNVAALTEASGGTFDRDTYPDGQFTNGDTWATQLGLAPSLQGGTNFAFGGARAAQNDDEIPDLYSQAFSFANSGIEVDENSVGAIWVGGNDFLALEEDATADDIGQLIETVVTKIATTVQGLHEYTGLDRFVVLGLPDFGLLPANASDPAASAGATALTTAYNAALESTLAGLDAVLPDADVDFFDVEGFFDEIITSVPPELVSVPCLADPAGCAADPLDYALYDPIHPSAWVHAALADAIGQEIGLSEIPLPATAPLLVAGLGGLGLWARRRKSQL